MISTLDNVIARRDLVGVLVRAELLSSVAGSKLGWIWWFFDPILMMLVYWCIVSGIFDRDAGLYAPYPIFLFVALITWKHFATAVNRALNLLQSNERLIKSIPFPTIVLPLSIVFSGFVYFLFGFVILLIAAGIWRSERHTGDYLPLIQVPALMVLQLAITAGVCMAMSCYGALLRDLRLFTSHLLRVGFYVAPGLYGVEMIEARLGEAVPGGLGESLFVVYMANPFAVLITGYRDAVLYGSWIPPMWWVLICVEAVVVLWAGYRIYQHHDRRVIKFL